MKYKDLRVLQKKLNKTISKDSVDKYIYTLIELSGIVLEHKSNGMFFSVMRGKQISIQEIDIVVNRLGKFFMQDPNRYIHSNYPLLRFMLCIHQNCTRENLQVLLLDNLASIREHACERLKKRGEQNVER